MKTRDLMAIGIPPGICAETAKQILQRTHAATGSAAEAHGELTRRLVERGVRPPARQRGDAPYRIWGDGLEPTAVQQLKNACQLPVAVSGALMPDAHVGYGLPIGGVLATENAVIP